MHLTEASLQNNEKDIRWEDHGRETRNRACLINLPTIKLHYARRGFYFTWAKLYNELPLNIRTAPSSEDFYKLLNLHY